MENDEKNTKKNKDKGLAGGIRLRPIIYTANTYKSGSNNLPHQILLLQALKVTNDPKKLRKMIGVRTVAEVYRTLDKLAMRREYHQALARAGVSFDFMAQGLKNEAVGGDKSADRIKAFQILLKSIGLDKYEAIEGASTNTWEEALLESIEKDDGTKALPEGEKDDEVKEYDVIEPPMPDSLREIHDEEDRIGKELYG